MSQVFACVHLCHWRSALVYDSDIPYTRNAWVTYCGWNLETMRPSVVGARRNSICCVWHAHFVAWIVKRVIVTADRFITAHCGPLLSVQWAGWVRRRQWRNVVSWHGTTVNPELHVDWRRSQVANGTRDWHGSDHLMERLQSQAW